MKAEFLMVIKVAPKLIGIALLVSTLVSSCRVSHGISDERMRTMLIQLKEVHWPKAYATHDTILLDRILGDDFQMIDNNGLWSTKEDEMNWIRKNKTENDSFHYEIKRLEVLSNGTAIICGTGHIMKNQEKSEYQSSNVLVWRKNKWEAVLSHVSGYKSNP